MDPVNTKLQRHRFTPGEDDAIRRWLQDGLTHSQIALRMGYTKGMICGRAARIGAKPQVRTASKVRARRSEREKLARQGVLPVQLQKPAPRVLQYGRVSACQWIDGDVLSGTWTLCEAPVQAGSSYCPAHHARCYKKLEETSR